MTQYTPTEIKEKIKSFKVWYQNIDLNGIQTNPTKKDAHLKWKLFEPYVPKNLDGKTVLDLSCNAGFFSIKMKERGAKVLGIDGDPEAIEEAKFAAEVLDLDIDYKLENIYDFLLKNKQKFDYVLFLGLFYHLRYPLLVLDRVANITKEKLYFQTDVRNSDQTKITIPDDIPYNEIEIFNDPNFPKLFFIEKKDMLMILIIGLFVMKVQYLHFFGVLVSET